MISVQNPTLANYIELMRDGRLKLARYGDGEWHCILKHPGQNCDGHTYFPELGDELKAAITADNHIHGWLAVSRKAGVPSVTKFIRQHDLGDLTWHEGSLLANENMAGRLRAFMQAIRQQPVLYVGPDYLRGLTRLFRVSTLGFVEVPRVNCYLERVRIETEIRQYIRLYEPGIIGFSAGMLSKVLIHQLATDYSSINLIDFGSMWDGYFGVFNRSYLKGANYSQLMTLNFGA